MAPLPKRRLSRMRQGRRRSTINFKKLSLANCSNCGNPKLPHQVCVNCGTYKGEVIKAPKIKTKIARIAKDTKK